jgi:hypothetical protein
MAKTFKALCGQADFSTPSSSIEPPKDGQSSENSTNPIELEQAQQPNVGHLKPLSLQYNLQVILPDTRDIKVYDAIFSSLRKHLG